MLEKDTLRYKPCTHLGALFYWQKKQKAQITTLCDTQIEYAKAAAKFFSLKNVEFLNNPERVIQTKPDFLVIATNTPSHYDLLTQALYAKIPRIVVEKPVAWSVREAKLLRKKIAKSTSVILPNYERRYHPKYIALQKKIAHARTYRGLFAAGGKSLYIDKKTGDEGVLLHDTTHLLDLAQFFFGSITGVEKILKKNQHILYLEHATGISGVIETVLNVGAFHLELEIFTAEKKIRVGNGFLETEEIRLSKHYKNFKSYDLPKLVLDSRMPYASNPFIKLYESALLGTPTNAHFFDALQNVELLG
ncbi:MAG: Inositol 2-dehydrogenase/D-chiro-inositol 3-dehydrogenase [Turneriella sp.]|nr:Inositol 2-dehydrogenase/D-chiro-inositol 3-dehydrogenase [Turneriella sp.]